MTTCTNGPKGTRCFTCALWDENAELRKRVADAEQAMRCAQGERESTKFWKRQMHDAMQSTIARGERIIRRQEAQIASLKSAVDALRNVLGRTIERRVDPELGKPYTFLGEERKEALALVEARPTW